MVRRVNSPFLNGLNIAKCLKSLDVGDSIILEVHLGKMQIAQRSIKSMVGRVIPGAELVSIYGTAGKGNLTIFHGLKITIRDPVNDL